MDKELSIQTTALIARDFGIDIGEHPLSEEELLRIVADEVAYMLEYRTDFLMSLLYRLDVSEHKISHALSPFCIEPANITLAKLIIERQHQRILTKRQYKQPKPKDLEDELDF
ncbi:MAG TPA: hypothetical protein ENJ45_01890 [Phaeodactylibacter sp.]|nr:hypothetical protein [Phaeodactylibacter sp.]